MSPGRGIFRHAVRLLPSPQRDRVRDEMLAIYDARMQDAAGPAARARVWLSEMAGVLSAARRLRGGRRAPVGGGSEALRDARFALRTMARRPGAAVLAVLTCGLGIGSASAMFSIVDGVLLRPLPWPDPERVVSIYPTLEEWKEIPNLRANWDRGAFSQPEFVEWSSQQTSFTDVAIVSVWRRYLTGHGPASIVQAGVTSPGLFALADVRPVRGRLLRAEDGAAGAPHVAVVTQAFWRTRLGASDDAIGETLLLNGVAWTVIGVLPERFRVTGFDADVWLPVPLQPDERERQNHNFRGIGRLAPGVTLAQAEEETAQILGALSAEYEKDLTHRANVEPRLEDVTRNVRAPLLLLLGGALVLLFAACANFASLLLGTGLDRTTELAVRGALGAGRRRIVRLLLTESLLLALLGGALGVLLAVVLTRGLVLLAPPGVPRIGEVAVNARALGVAFTAALLAGLVFGAVPALALGGEDVASRLRAARATTRRRHRLHAALVVGQVALATLLLVVGGLLARTLLHLDSTDPNFDPDPLLAVAIAPPTYRFFDGEGAFRRDAYTGYFDGMRAALEEVPGVEAVASTAVLPFGGGRANNDIEPEGYTPAPGEQLIAERAFVSGNYLSVIGARLVDGRLLTPADDRPDAAPVMVVSRRFARQVWPDGAVGRRVKFWAGEFTVVGVIEDMHDRSLEADEDLRMYIPEQVADQSGGDFVLRVAGDPARVVAAVRDRLAAFDEDLPVTRVAPLRDLIGRSLAEQRYRARLLLCFAALALFFAASGIYGTMSRRVALRRHEIGIRMALGARRRGVLAGVLREGVLLAAGGMLLGALVALAASRLVVAWLSGVAPTDPLTWAGISAVLGGAAALAALAPSLRASRIDPMDCLRAD